MTKRYFNLKIGSEGVFGGVIEFNSAETLEKRLSDFYESYWKFKYLKNSRSNEIYSLIIPDIEFSANPITSPGGFRTNVAVPTEKGRPTNLQLIVDGEGNIKLHNYRGREKIYLKEISEKDATKLKNGKNEWDLLRAYIVE